MTLAAGGLVDVGDFADTGWFTVDLVAGITHVAGYTLSYRRKSGVVYYRGRVAGLVAATQTTITNTPVPEGFRPGAPTHDLGIIANSATTKARVFVQSTGHIGIRTDAGTEGYVFGSYLAEA